MSISEIGLMDAVKNGNYEIIDRSVAKNYDEQREIFSKAVLADYYLMSSNAITLDGELINICLLYTSRTQTLYSIYTSTPPS